MCVCVGGWVWVGVGGWVGGLVGACVCVCVVCGCGCARARMCARMCEHVWSVSVCVRGVCVCVCVCADCQLPCAGGDSIHALFVPVALLRGTLYTHS